MRGLKNYYYPQTLKMICSSVVGMFSNIVIFRFDENSNKTKLIKVPVMFGNAMKRQRFENEEEARLFYTQTPRINVKFNGMSMALDRMESPLTERYWNEKEIHFKEVDHKNEVLREINGFFKDFNPIPYDYEFEIQIPTTSLNDTSQILENVLPYFTPKNTSILRVKEFSFLNIERDLPVEINNVNLDMGDDFGQEDDRIITANFGLGVEGFIYRPIESSKIVKSILCDYLVENYLDTRTVSDENGTEIITNVNIDGE